jgi:hypothetical protein
VASSGLLLQFRQAGVVVWQWGFGSGTHWLHTGQPCSMA